MKLNDYFSVQETDKKVFYLVGWFNDSSSNRVDSSGNPVSSTGISIKSAETNPVESMSDDELWNEAVRRLNQIPMSKFDGSLVDQFSVAREQVALNSFRGIATWIILNKEELRKLADVFGLVVPDFDVPSLIGEIDGLKVVYDNSAKGCIMGYRGSVNIDAGIVVCESPEGDEVIMVNPSYYVRFEFTEE